MLLDGPTTTLLVHFHGPDQRIAGIHGFDVAFAANNTYSPRASCGGRWHGLVRTL